MRGHAGTIAIVGLLLIAMAFTSVLTREAVSAERARLFSPRTLSDSSPRALVAAPRPPGRAAAPAATLSPLRLR